MKKEREYRIVEPIEKAVENGIDDRDKVKTPIKKLNANAELWNSIWKNAKEEVKKDKREEQEREGKKSFQDTVYDMDSDNQELENMLKDNEEEKLDHFDMYNLLKR